MRQEAVGDILQHEHAGEGRLQVEGSPLGPPSPAQSSPAQAEEEGLPALGSLTLEGVLQARVGADQSGRASKRWWQQADRQAGACE